MEELGLNVSSSRSEFWRGKRVLVTGHTGFKGGWLSLWLHSMGAKVSGYSLPPATADSFYSICKLDELFSDELLGDIRERKTLQEFVGRASPEIVFHLAAQPIVRASYADPAETFDVNVMGLVSMLDAVRNSASVRTFINVTSDKCYANSETGIPFLEGDPMGGDDPYSASKGCAELVTAAYRKSFLAEAGIGCATARAGNVIGGGDFAVDRLIPDVLRALHARTVLQIRSPNAVRPWQHVLEPLSGYIALAKKLHTSPQFFARGWNFGSLDEDAQTVEWILKAVKARRPSLEWTRSGEIGPHEAGVLRLDSARAIEALNWAPRWDLDSAIARTLEWDKAWRGGLEMRASSLEQLRDYLAAAPRSIHVPV